jgi:hypothetical protein
VNTTFTLEKLTEDQGARQIKGSLDTGQTWNRTEAVTESGSFEQSGAGATAAITGSAFTGSCIDIPGVLPTDPVTQECSWISVIHGLIITSTNGEVRFLPEHSTCDSTAPEGGDGDLCDTPRELTLDELALIEWVQTNLVRDYVERGYCCPILTGFDITIENGKIVAVSPPQTTQQAITATTTTTTTTSPSSSSSSSSSSTSTTTTTTTLPPPGVASLPVDVEQGGSNGGCSECGDPGLDVPAPGPQSGIITEDEVSPGDSEEPNPVIFTVRLTNPAGVGDLFVKFTELPDNTFGVIQWCDPNAGGGQGAAAVGDCAGEWVGVTTTDLYPDAEHFRFLPVQYESNTPDCQEQYPEGTVLPSFDDCFNDGDYPGTVTNNLDGTVSWTTSFSVQPILVLTSPSTTITGAPVSIPIVIVDDICNEDPYRFECSLVTTTLGGLANQTFEATVTTDAPVTTSPPTTAATDPPATDPPATDPPATDPPTTEETTTTTAGDQGA